MDRGFDSGRRRGAARIATQAGALSAWAALVLGAGCIDPAARTFDADTTSLPDVPDVPDATAELPLAEVGDAPDGDPAEVVPACTLSCERGTCDETGRCQCPEGFSGPTCGEALCVPACANGGRCSEPGACDCAGTGFAGPRCEDKVCGDDPCPALSGYTATCNSELHCEYSRALITEAWHADDVWIHVPAGAFPMGSPELEPAGGLERPIVDVVFEHGFFIGKFEVTTRTHEACEAMLGGCATPNANDFAANGWDVNRSAKVRAQHPQNGLTQAQALKVCTFLGGRLPTSAEWEFAAKGPNVHRQYPWGNTPTPECAVHAIFDATGYGCGHGGTAFVGPGERTAGRSAVGALDMAGNVWEWVQDCWHDSYEGAPDDGSAWTADCQIEAAGPLGQARGGAMSATNMRSATRLGLSIASRRADVGVRCVKNEL